MLSLLFTTNAHNGRADDNNDAPPLAGEAQS
jgi:hypothetical protein